MKFSEMKPKQLREAKSELIQRLGNTLSPSRIVSLSDTGCTIEGGTFPAMYSHTHKELSIWGRGSRYSGGSMTIVELAESERVCKEFFNEHLELGGYVE